MSIEEFKNEVKAELEENILPFWMERMTDPEGGFFGRIDGKGNIEKNAVRGGILNARILWTFASAYRLTGKVDYFETAMAAKDEIIGHFYDEEFGGTFWSLEPDGRPHDTKKQIYAIAFAIYGLSELYRASGDDEALDYAIKLYEDIEAHSFDNRANGYFEAFTRDWSPIEDMRLSDKDQNDAKTMNTHLHILEGYTALYRVWDDEGLARQLRNLIEIFLDKILASDGHLALFFDEDWRCTSHTVSYGHDIECSWLLAEAAEVLGDESLIARVKEACSHTVNAALEGWTPDGGMIYEKELPAEGCCCGAESSSAIGPTAPAATEDADGCRIDSDRHWWVQAETVVGALWQYRRSGDPVWLKRATDEWEFIKRDIICPDGEWYWSRRADGSANTADDRAGFWKCPYHNGRMCMEVLERI